MKLKRLKKIQVGDTEFKIIWDKKTSGGWFSYKDQEMGIGTQLGETRTFAVLIHELKEVIQVEQATRFERYDESSNYEFHYNHAQHTELCSRLSGLLSKFL